jgi:hypothetical protein
MAHIHGFCTILCRPRVDSGRHFAGRCVRDQYARSEGHLWARCPHDCLGINRHYVVDELEGGDDGALRAHSREARSGCPEPLGWHDAHDSARKLDPGYNLLLSNLCASQRGRGQRGHERHSELSDSCCKIGEVRRLRLPSAMVSIKSRNAGHATTKSAKQRRKRCFFRGRSLLVSETNPGDVCKFLGFLNSSNQSVCNEFRIVVSKQPFRTSPGFFSSDHKALAAWYQKHLGIKLESWGGAVLRWPQDTAEAKSATAWKVTENDTKWFNPSRGRMLTRWFTGHRDTAIELSGTAPRRQQREPGEISWTGVRAISKRAGQSICCLCGKHAD